MDWMAALDEKAFEQGKTREYWKSDLELEKWFDPSFQEFINNELIPAIKQ